MNLSLEDKLLLQQYFAGIPVKKAYLFGSMARNEAREESDIDILVELDHSIPIGNFSYINQTLRNYYIKRLILLLQKAYLAM